MIDNTPICAISTAQGNGAIAVIRISGKGSIDICDKIFHSPKSDKKLANQEANTLHFGTLKDKDIIIDEVVLSLFKNPHSYTGEDIIEISCHGSEYIQQKILQLLIKNGAQQATAGEYTMRAFLNGKMDLSQAEAVGDLIASTSSASHKVALNQMRGGFSSEITLLRNELLNFISLIELELDFSEEDVEFADRKQLRDLLSKIEKIINKLLKSFELGNVIKNGVPVAIVGHTNVGKSTLLNKLLNEEKAIVSEIAGTTRDVIEDVINIEGISFRFIDTAGIRDTKDKIENLGIERTFDKIDKASIVLLLVDANEKSIDIEKAISRVKKAINKKQKLIIIVNKLDLIVDKDKLTTIHKILNKYLEKSDTNIEISAKSGKNVDILINELINTISLETLNQNEVIITNTRHFEALNNSSEALLRAKEGLLNNISGDFLAMDIREVLHYLGEITGQVSTDEVLGNIFSKFCIGK
ncbi:MAG: tRNA uridine-5-carboxymethylaminomethyl(34) synthesis GTPase MnmE [Bacteroidales bacterium]|jgi:tRNA modification GTPase|nr:tRNA uridine-5-carboxymethylaminomethyl(34) synthesis GTPase MnmE [Bacteroidales bacterium]